MKVGYFSPLHPVKSGISEYSEREVLPYLKEYCEIDIIIDKNYKAKSKFINENFKVIPYDRFENNYDLLIYHMGNNPFHEYMYKMALKFPGILVLHDPFLHHLQIHMTVAKKNEEGYRKILQYCLGKKGKQIADNALNSYVWPHFDYPLVKEIVDSSKAVIVHSNFAREIILRETKEHLIKQIKMPITISQNLIKSDLRTKLKIPQDFLVIGTFGHVGFYKRIDIALQAFAEFVKSFPKSIFLIAGEFQTKEYEKEIHFLIKKLGIENKVIETGYVSNLFSYVEISDISVQLRYPTAGETSIITLQIMGLGKPILISNVGSFREIPDDASIKINVDSKEKESILQGFQKLSEKNFRIQLGQNAQKYIENEHDPKKIAYEFFNFTKLIQNQELLKNLNLKISELSLHDKKVTENIYQLAKAMQKNLP